MKSKYAAIAVIMLLATGGCATKPTSPTITSSAPAREGAILASSAPAREGAILVSPAEIPSGIKYKVIGTVQADKKDGYSNAESLYSALADEARKLGANAVVNTTGGRRVTEFSWAAPYVRGTAVKVDDPQMLKGLSGSYH
jgi:hypothetical protein